MTRTRKPRVWCMVMWTDPHAAPDRRHNEAGYKIADVPALLATLAARGIATVWIDDVETATRKEATA